jgi:phosphoribosylformylglycinamidine (FGAM) synthase-like enzyme
VDECIRQLVAVGADPDRIAILDNFCMGNPDDHTELGGLVECVKGMAHSATVYAAPFVSGKDSFYNYFVTDEGPVSIPVTLLVSGFGIIEGDRPVVGSSLRKVGSKLCVLGHTTAGMRGSVARRVFSKMSGTSRLPDTVADFSEEQSLARYRAYYGLAKTGAILSTHDVSEGGLATALAEMTFSGKAGVKVDLAKLPADQGLHAMELLFSETPGRMVLEVAADHLAAAEQLGFICIGETTEAAQVVVNKGSEALLDVPVAELKPLWKSGLASFY